MKDWGPGYVGMESALDERLHAQEIKYRVTN